MLFIAAGCTAQGGRDDSYYRALVSLKAGDEKAALRALRSLEKVGRAPFSRLALEELCAAGPLNERIAAARRLVKAYDDDDARLIAAKLLFERGTSSDYRRILDITSPYPAEASPSAPTLPVSHPLFALRLLSLHRLGRAPEAAVEMVPWFTQEPFTESHAEVLSAFEDMPPVDTPTLHLIRLREAVAKRSYTAAVSSFDILTGGMEDSALWVCSLSRYLLSDIGRALLYGTVGTANMEERAAWFEKAGGFYGLFYAGRLYDRGSKSPEKALRCLYGAAEIAPDGDRRDDALWYYFNTLVKEDPKKAAEALETLPWEAENTAAFASLCEELSEELLGAKAWEHYLRAQKVIQKLGGENSVPRYSYVAGRLLEEGLARETSGKRASEYFRSALEGSDLYYLFAAAARLQETAPFPSPLVHEISPAAPQGEIEAILTGYIAYKIPERVYPLWLKTRDRLSDTANLKLASALEEEADEEFRIQGLRIAAWTGGNSEESLRLQYPRFFLDEVSASAAEFGVEEYLVFSLIRAESFFIREVRSRVQAQGLTQLMGDTADDIARRLGIQDYDVNDAYTNVRFGTFYYADQIRRQNGSVLAALFAYNAGPNRVRTWKSRFAYPPDLFLEMVPFAETRGYGRRNVTGAAVYGYLYYGGNPVDLTATLLGAP